MEELSSRNRPKCSPARVYGALTDLRFRTRTVCLVCVNALIACVCVCMCPADLVRSSRRPHPVNVQEGPHLVES